VRRQIHHNLYRRGFFLYSGTTTLLPFSAPLSFRGLSTSSCSERNFSASRAAIHPDPIPVR
jgi:hypothetical protein